MVTKAQTRQDVADNLFPFDRFRRGTTNGSGNTASLLIDDNLKSNMVRPNRLIDAWVLITAGAKAGESAQVEQFDHVNGKLGLAGGISGDPGQSNAYEVFYGVDPEQFLDAIKEMQRRTRAPQLWIPSLLSDPYLEATIGDHWTDQGAPTTTVYDTDGANVLLGEKALAVASADDGEGVYSEPFNALTNERLIVSAWGRGGDFDVRLVVSLNGAIIGEARLLDLDWQEARFNEIVTDGTTAVEVRFISNAAAQDFYISAPIVVQSGFERLYQAPSWLLAESQIEEAVVIPQGRAADLADTYHPLSRDMEASLGMRWVRSDRDVHPLHVRFANPSPNDLVAIRAKRPMSESAAAAIGTAWVTEDAVDIPVDREYAAAKVTSILLRKRGIAGWKRWEREADRHARRLSYGGRALHSEERRVAV